MGLNYTQTNSINNSVEIIKELESLKRKIAILTKIHTLYEMKVKVEDLRNNRKIKCTIFFVPPGIKKHNVIIPNGQLLIDDSEKILNYGLKIVEKVQCLTKQSLVIQMKE